MTDPRQQDAHDEADIRRRVFNMAASGRDVPRELLDAWQAAKKSSLEHFRKLGRDEAQERILEAIREVETSVERLEEGGRGNPASQLHQALELGERVRWYLWVLDALADGPAGDPLSFVEEEVGWVRRGARELTGLEEELQRQGSVILGETEKARALLTRRKLQRFAARRDVEPPGATALERALNAWLRVMESFQLEGEQYRGAGWSGEREPPTDELKRLEDLRAKHIQECREALEECGGSDVLQVVRRVVADLGDAFSAAVSENYAGRFDDAVLAWRLLGERMAAFHGILRDIVPSLDLDGDTNASDQWASLRRDLQRLKRLKRRTRAALLEARTNCRIEKVFGPRFVALFENFLFLLILGFLGLVVVEMRTPEGSPHIQTIHRIDLILCCFFQVDFFVRWGFSRWSGSYFLRHFFFESLPALPYGMIFHHLRRIRDVEALEEARLIIFVRILRSERVLVALMRAARIIRVILFFVRGADRAVEKFRGFLDRDVVVFEPHSADGASDATPRERLVSVEARRKRLVRVIYADVPLAERPGALTSYLNRIDVESGLASEMDVPYQRTVTRAAGEIHLEDVIRGFLDCDEATVVSYLGYTGTKRIARWLRFLDVPLLRSLPVIRRLAPAGRSKDHPEAVAKAARATGQLLQDILGALRFWGDLSGITTGPQVLDRVATTLIAATKRPAVRLLMFGGAFVLLKGLVVLLVELFQLQEGYFEAAFGFLAKVLGMPLLILGSICLVLLLTGKWFKKIAGEALDVYLRTADAHSYSLLKLWKVQRCEKNLRFLYQSVFLPEVDIRPGGEAPEDDWVRFLCQPLMQEGGLAGRRCEPPDERFRCFRDDRDLVTLLYRDFLDGPILQRLDDKTSVQLLGNLVVQEIRVQTLGLTRKELRRLEWLDLGKDRILTLGPYFWFRFITESLAIEAAKLVMEYNTTCIPVDERSLASPEDLRRFENFLHLREGSWNRAAAQRSARAMQRLGEPVATQYFSALDFLTVDPKRQEYIASRFGHEVLTAVRKDRKGLVRDIFGTRPYHLLPRAQRIFNPYVVYRRYFSGARILVLPLRLTGKVVYAGERHLVRVVREVLGKARGSGSSLPRAAGFDVAIRKLNRMRKPFFMEALELRAAIDVDYLGIRLPGQARRMGTAGYRQDLDFIEAMEVERRPIEELKSRAVRDLRRLRNYLEGRGWLKDGMAQLVESIDTGGELREHRAEVVRAVVTAFITDQDSLRSSLLSVEQAREFVDRAVGERGVLRRSPLKFILALTRGAGHVGRRRRALLDEYLEFVPDLRHMSPEERRKVLWAFLSAPAETEHLVSMALEHLRKEACGGDAALEKLRTVARDHPRWTRKIMTARAVQAVTVLDIQSYRDLVHDLGEY